MRNALLTMADYHCWACAILYQSVVPLTDQQYRAEVGLFFGSIHRTLNHLLVGDHVWFGRLSGSLFSGVALDTELEPERDRLQQRLNEQSARWHAWLAGPAPEQLNGTVCYTNMSGATFTQPLASVLLHVFNHGTHHHGQISAAITAHGHPAPAMDLIGYLRQTRSTAA